MSAAGLLYLGNVGWSGLSPAFPAISLMNAWPNALRFWSNMADSRRRSQAADL